MAGLAGIPSSPPFSDETVDKVTALLNSGQVNVNEVSGYFSVPVPAIIQALTDVSPDAYTSGDPIADADVDAVMKMVNSGVATPADVADYFSTSQAIVESYLTDVELYTAEDIANVQEGIAVASADARNIVADGDYTEEEINIVADSINNGLLSAAQAAQQFNVTEAQVLDSMERILTPNERASVSTGKYTDNGDGTYSDAVGNIFNEVNGQLTVDQALTGEQLIARDGPAVAARLAAAKAAADKAAADAAAVSGGATGGAVGGAVRGGGTDKGDGTYMGRILTPNDGSVGGATGAVGGAVGGPQVVLPAATGMETLMPSVATTAYTTGAQIPTGLRGSEIALKGGAAGAIQMLDQINRSGRGDLAGRYNAGLTAAKEAATTAQGYISPFQTAGTEALKLQQDLSGMNGKAAFDLAYQQSPQMAFLQKQGLRSQLAGAGATGNLGGGNIQKELTRFGQGLASQGLQQQIGNLGQIATQGYNAGRDLSNISTGLGGQQLSAQQNLGNQLAQLGLNTGLPAASNLSTLGVNLATGRTKVGEQLADQYGNASKYLADTYSNTGSNIANAIGTQANNINAQNEAAANNAARNQVGYGSALSGIQGNMGAQISGVPNTPIAQPNYATAIGNALGAGGFAYDMFQPNKAVTPTNAAPAGSFTNQQTQGFGNFYYGQPNTATLGT